MNTQTRYTATLITKAGTVYELHHDNKRALQTGIRKAMRGENYKTMAFFGHLDAPVRSWAIRRNG